MINSVQKKSYFLLFVMIMVAPSVFALNQQVEKARTEVLSGDLSLAVQDYSDNVQGSQDAVLKAEYGWVLVKAGYVDLGLAQLDRALQLDPTNTDVLYYTSAVLKQLGQSEAAAEISRPEPQWLEHSSIENKTIVEERAQSDLGESYKSDINVGTGLLMQRRYASAVERYHLLTKAYPNEKYVWAGYAIALESIGAYKASAQAVEKDIKLSGKSDEKIREMMISHKKELEARAPLETPNEKKKANSYLKGRYLIFFGGSVNRTTSDTYVNINGRAGKFLTDHVDVGINAGFITGYSNSDYNGLSFGISGRYLTPLPVSAPLSFAIGTRLQYAPSPSSDKTSIYLSPGLSYFLQNGSIDLTVDLGLAGPLKDTKTISVGYTMYIGGAK